jgi:hypothetical protein
MNLVFVGWNHQGTPPTCGSGSPSPERAKEACGGSSEKILTEGHRLHHSQSESTA